MLLNATWNLISCIYTHTHTHTHTHNYREALSLFNEDKAIFSTQDESTPHFILFQNGKKNAKNCMHARKTCALVESFPEAAGCKRGTVKFSALPPLSHIFPFVGPTNTRLQVVVGLDMDSESGVRIRLAEETRYMVILSLFTLAHSRILL